VRKADNLPPSCAIVTKSGKLNFLEPFGPVQAYNGTALPLVEKVFKSERLIKKSLHANKLGNLIICFGCQVLS